MEESKPSSIQPNHVAQNTFRGETAPASAMGAARAPVTISAMFPPSDFFVCARRTRTDRATRHLSQTGPRHLPGEYRREYGNAAISAMRSRLNPRARSLAPAVLADLALDHLAGIRTLEQRAHAAAIDAVRRGLIFGLLRRHFIRRFCLRGAATALPRSPPANARMTVRRHVSAGSRLFVSRSMEIMAPPASTSRRIPLRSSAAC